MVQLPSWFAALNTELRYQLTPVGAPAPNLHVAQALTAAANSFKIGGGSGGLQVCWQVTGIRQDPYGKAHTPVVEQNKSAAEQGYYVHPEVYNQPPARNIRWIRKPAWMQFAQQMQTWPATNADFVAKMRNPDLEKRLRQPPPTPKSVSSDK